MNTEACHEYRKRVMNTGSVSCIPEVFIKTGSVAWIPEYLSWRLQLCHVYRTCLLDNGNGLETNNYLEIILLLCCC